jgi:hypothetical protein
VWTRERASAYMLEEGQGPHRWPARSRVQGIGCGSSAATGKESAKEAMTAEQKVLKEKIDQTGIGGLSFFAWFGFIGRRVSAKERGGDEKGGGAEEEEEAGAED